MLKITIPLSHTVFDTGNLAPDSPYGVDLYLDPKSGAVCPWRTGFSSSGPAMTCKPAPLLHWARFASIGPSVVGESVLEALGAMLPAFQHAGVLITTLGPAAARPHLEHALGRAWDAVSNRLALYVDPGTYFPYTLDDWRIMAEDADVDPDRVDDDAVMAVAFSLERAAAEDGVLLSRVEAYVRGMLCAYMKENA